MSRTGLQLTPHRDQDSIFHYRVWYGNYAASLHLKHFITCNIFNRFNTLLKCIDNRRIARDARYYAAFAPHRGKSSKKLKKILKLTALQVALGYPLVGRNSIQSE